MTSTLDEGLDNESWGIKDFFLFIGKCHNHCTACNGPAANQCTACESTHQLDDGKCKESVQWAIAAKDFTEKELFTDIKGWELKNYETKTPFS